MGSTAQNLADVIAEFSYVGSRLSANLKENISLVHLQEVVIVDCSCPELPLNRRTYRRTLIDGSLKIL
jgi:hypothetical protein